MSERRVSTTFRLDRLRLSIRAAERIQRGVVREDERARIDADTVRLATPAGFIYGAKAGRSTTSASIGSTALKA